MPFFDYHCADCGRDFELMLSIRDRDARGRTCPDCGSKRIERKISAPRIAGGKDFPRGDCGPGGFT